MNQPVLLKGNSLGLTMVLDPGMKFDQLIKAIEDKFVQAKDFFNGQTQIALKIEGRKLDAKELQNVLQIIAEKTGAKVKETWLTGQTDVEAIGTMIAGGEYPDFIEGGNGQMQLYDADALVALDDYLDDYPNIKNLFSDLEWEKLRQDDGHIYWIPQFSCIKNEEKVCTHNDEAFWIQARVLKWAGYPEIKTMDDYFNLIESYNEANPTMEDGTENIPYTILCDDWRYFCMANAPP